MNDETNPVQRGLDTLNASPVEHLENSSPQIQEELGARSEQIQQEVAAKSALPNPNQFNLYNRDGEFITDGETVDGDGPVSGFRIAYNPEVEADQGKSFDAWETDHGDDFNNSPAQAKKLARQRRALADLLGEPVEAITNEDVFAMGEASKQRAAEFFRTQDGINKITVDDSQTFKSNREGDDRVLGHVFRNAEGTDIRTFMNNPLDNANYSSRFNIRGRAEAELGAGLKGEEELSDFEATQTTKGRIENAGLTLRDALNNTGADIGDLFANTIGKIVGQFKAGEADITPEDEATFRRIRENMVQAEKEAELEVDKANAASKNEQIEDATAEAIANLYGDPVPETPTTSFAQSDERKAAVAKRADEILRSRLTPEEIAFMDGTGTATRVTKSTSTSKLFDSAELRGEVGKVVETKNDKFETLDTQRKVRESIHKVGQTTLGDIASGEAFEEGRDTKVNPVTGAPESFKTANTALSDIADKTRKF